MTVKVPRITLIVSRAETFNASNSVNLFKYASVLSGIFFTYCVF